MLQLIHFFLSQNWEVTFGSASFKNPNAINLQELGVQEFSLKLNHASFDLLLKEIDPTLVVFDRFMTEEQFGWRVSEQCPDALRILDTEDLHCLRKVREQALKKEVEFSTDLLLNANITKREIASMYRSDISFIISDYEMKLLENVFKIDKSLLLHIPFMLDEISEKSQKEWISFEDRTHFVSIGNFLHAPNVDATKQLKQTIWPGIKKQLPKAELHIYGAYPTQQVLQLTDKQEGFYVHGFVENAKELIGKYRVLLAPLRFGAGIKGKLTEAMLCGTPSVTTTIGAEGMSGNLPWNGFVEDDFEAFSKKAVELYTDRHLWEQSQEKGIQIINTHYQKKITEEKLLSGINYVFNNLGEHRTQNFIGSMLSHHTLQSTKYLSKWIEEKNN